MKPKQKIDKSNRRYNKYTQNNIKNKSDDFFANFDSYKAYYYLEGSKSQRKSQTHQKQVKILIISFSNTISYPRTMVIKSFNAHITIITMSCPWWSKDITCITEFQFLRMSFDSGCIKNRLVFADCPIDVSFIYWYFSIVWVLKVAKYFGDDPRINPCKHKHKHISGNMKKNSEDNKNPEIRMSGESIHQTQSNINESQGTEIFFGL